MPRLTQRGVGVSWVGGVQVVVHHWNVEVNPYIIHTRKSSVLFHMFQPIKHNIPDGHYFD